MSETTTTTTTETTTATTNDGVTEQTTTTSSAATKDRSASRKTRSQQLAAYVPVHRRNNTSSSSSSSSNNTASQSTANENRTTTTTTTTTPTKSTALTNAQVRAERKQTPHIDDNANAATATTTTTTSKEALRHKKVSNAVAEVERLGLDATDVDLSSGVVDSFANARHVTESMPPPPPDLGADAERWGKSDVDSIEYHTNRFNRAFDNFPSSSSSSFKRPITSSSSSSSSSSTTVSTSTTPYLSSSVQSSSSKAKEKLAADSAEQKYENILEAYDLTSSIKDWHIEAVLKAFDERFTLRWVDESHCLIVFYDADDAIDALAAIDHPIIHLRKFADASRAARALYLPEALWESESQVPRPASSSAVARRLIGGALNMPKITDADKAARLALQTEREQKRLREEQRQKAVDDAFNSEN